MRILIENNLVSENVDQEYFYGVALSFAQLQRIYHDGR